MSSILIKDMDMPKHAIKNGTDDTLYRSCVIVHPDGTAELILDSTFADMFGFEHNFNRFPLVEIPTPHGDLIDRDHLLSLIEGWNEDVENDKQNENSFVVGKTLNGVIRIIRGAHAFTEAEEEQ